MAVKDNSDYTKLRTKLYDLVPDVYKSNTNRAVFGNLFDRYLTKQESTHTVGYVGKGNSNAITSRNIAEPTLHRQAFQLQPILRSKIGSVEHMAAWEDIRGEYERLGVDIEQFDEWGRVLQFNWVPPIDIDKLINYRDYYWVNDTNTSVRPEYITMRSRCSTAVANSNFWSSLVDTYGSDFPIAELLVDLSNPLQYNRLRILGDYSRLLESGFVFFIRDTLNTELNNSFHVVTSVEYDDSVDQTIVTISLPVTDGTQGGVISLQENLNLYLAERDCQCSGGIGWDTLNWDDNPSDPLWDGSLASMLATVSNPGPPTTPGTNEELWYDTVGDAYYQYSTSLVSWKLLYNNFSLILDKTEGFALWDYSEGCGVQSRVPSAAQWTDTNYWLHKTDVPNFAKAKQAQLPIIEFDWDLELNEWTYTNYDWSYRSDKFGTFTSSDTEPSIIELQPLSYWQRDTSTNEIVLDDRYGDLTSFFVPGAVFQADTTTIEFYEVARSSYEASVPGQPYRTRITLTTTTFPTQLDLTGDIGLYSAPMVGTESLTPLFPVRTSVGDPWKEYGDHWLLVSVDNDVPVAHQPDNHFMFLNTTLPAVVDTNYEYVLTYGSQSFAVTTITDTFTFATDILTGTTRSLNNRALVGQNDIRVYINGIRQYGNYVENPTGIYVSGITFIAGFEPGLFDDVLIEVGEASMLDLGNYSVPVRTIVDNATYALAPTEYVSLAKYRKAEQVKTRANQYPLFDLYGMDSIPNNEVSSIFGYATSVDYPVNLNVGLRVVVDDTGKIYDFDQLILDGDDGELKAWRDYSNQNEDLWFNPVTQELFFFDNLSWSKKTDMGGFYREAVVSNTEPDAFDKAIDGLYWADTLNNVVFVRDAVGGTWAPVTTIDIRTSDITLQTIWRKGLYNEEYIPSKVDWVGRSESEYATERDTFIENRILEIMDGDSSILITQATSQATTDWLVSQSNQHSLTGNWIGDWEVPDPLYYNHLNENRKILNSSELLTHFTTIIQGQPTVPGFNGTSESMFHLIPTDEVNYGVGGTIREYNDSYDTAFSSIFVNNVTPISLFEFAHDQYESLLNNLEELFRRNASDYLLDVSQNSLINLTQTISDAVISAHELNDNSSLLYGDSTTFTDNVGQADSGVKNWIATLPYLKLMNATSPEKITDNSLDLNQVIHHDGHRNVYDIEAAVREEIITLTINTPDNRTRFPGPHDPALDNFGRVSTTDLPPNTATEFTNEFNTTIFNREGVYWHYTPIGGDRVLYRLSVVDIGNVEPSSLLIDGTLWMDMSVGAEVLRVKTTSVGGTVTWTPVSGNSVGDGRLHNGTDPSDVTTSTISAWTIVDLNDILTNIVLDVETRLYGNVPDAPQLRYDFIATRDLDPTRFDGLLQQAFLDYVTQSEIVGPFVNSQYIPTDPFTWNYKYSIPGAGFNIVETDANVNTISVQGNYTTFFNSPISFYIKNSITNDGKWTTLGGTATYDGLNNVTIIGVVEPVNPGVNNGVVYSGTLPSSLNTGTESGGDWRDYYNKLYGTPFPHLEPWKLQDYNEKPTWWDEEYANDDPLKWGNRRWKYKHGFGIVGVDNSVSSFSVTGDFRELFPTGKTFLVDKSVTHYGNYTVDTLLPIDHVILGAEGSAAVVFAGNVVTTIPIGMRFSVTDASGNFVKNLTVLSSTFTGPPNNETVVIVAEMIADATGFDSVSGATYNNISNKTEIRTTAVALAATVEGRIAMATGMWEQIRVGNIKAGERYPNSVLSVTGIPSTDTSLYSMQDPGMPTYNYFSVNIDNTPISSDGGTTNYYSDEILPPYWDYVPQFGASVLPFDRTIRSVFFNFSTEIKTPSIDYTFGDSGPIEYDWRTSSQFLYDQLTVAFKLDPIRLITHTFGIDFVEVGGLQVNSSDSRVFSHNRTNFHGEIINNKLLQVAGINQWYVNFNRATGFDISLADFRTLWTGWTAPLMYQMASFVDTDSLSIGHRTVPLAKDDYTVVAKHSPAVEDFWQDAFSVAVLKIPPKLIKYDTQADWRFEVSTNANRSRNIQYYGVHNYQFNVDIVSDTCKLYTWPIATASTYLDAVTVESNQTETFAVGRTIEINNSTGNDGSYVIESSVYDSYSNRTTIIVEGTLPDATDDGDVTVIYRTMPWNTGDVVYLSSSQLLPIPLQGDNSNGLYKYFIIVIDNTTFQLALTKQEAFSGLNVPIVGDGQGDSFVGEVVGTFTALGGERSSTVWRRYAIDKNTILNFDTPNNVDGVQSLVNIVHGYDVYAYDQGWRINDESGETDPDTNRIISWQVEIERFINTIYSLRTTRESVNDRYHVSADASNDTWTFIDPNSHFITGDPVNVMSTSTLPSPLINGLRYYVIRDSFDEFKIATSKLNARNGIALDITVNGTGNLYILAARDITYSAPRIEMNPFRNGIWFRPARGIVSDVLSGPTEDVKDQQLLFDQYSRPITLNQIRIFREDKRTQIAMAQGLINDVQIGSDVLNSYNNIHLGGAHIFVDTYEHVTMFNNYNSVGSLIYDPFIGLNLTKIEYDVERQSEFTQRPNMGGFYYETYFNQNASLRRNIEANIEDLRYAYDTYNVSENNTFVKQARKSLGYQGSEDYFDNLNMNDKSQFIFWRGMIQRKGSVNAINAFINSRRFIDAKVDEFWAYKIADFGSAYEKEYPEIFVTTIDSRSTDFRIEFITENNPLPLDNSTFVAISGADEERWVNQPDQVETLRDNGMNLYFDLKAVDSLELTTITNSPYIRHNFKADSIMVTANYYAAGKKAVGSLLANVATIDSYLVGAKSIQVYADGILQVLDVDYTETTNTTITFTSTPTNVEVLYVTSTLVEGNHFEQINSNIIKLLIADPTINTTVWGLQVNEDAQNPARLIDNEAEAVISTIPFWDPARGHHYFNSTHNISFKNDQDVATYNIDPIDGDRRTGPWGNTQVGTTWLDTLELDYVPYYDTRAFTNIEDRLRLWGQLSGTGNGKIYEWVKSDVPPTAWDDLAATEEGDSSILEAVRKSGKAKKTFFIDEDGAGNWMTYRDYVNDYINQVMDAAIEGTDIGGGNFTFSIVNVDLLAVGLADVYVNGILVLEQEDISGGTLTVPAKLADRVLVTIASITEDDKDTLALQANYKYEYQYSSFTKRDKLNNSYNEYYFWVADKSTVDSSGTRTVSALTAEQQMITIPTAYMVTQKVLPEDVIVIESNTLVNRVEYNVANAGQTVYAVGLPIAPSSTTSVFIGGFEVAAGDVTVTAQSITIATPATGGEDVKIEYVGLYDETASVPTRHVQLIIRGLRGLIDADRRYVVRFTRDFTLRDDLEAGKSSLDLKNDHQEWKIFREAQQYHVDRYLWDKITEAMVGYKLTDPSVRVPSLNRELYDARYLTATQIGIRGGQKFTDGTLALGTILSDLQDPNNNFQPVDINVFFEQYNFDTAENIIESMNTIYNTFPYDHVNRMYFSVLHDAFSLKDKYEDMFKTSMVALHGVRPFQVAGIFDD